MFLRSGRHLSNRQESKTASRVPTQGSGTRLVVGNLESIQESVSDSQFDTDSRTTSEILMGHNKSRDMHEAYSNANTGKSVNPFESTYMKLNYNVKLKFLYINAQGAKIFQEPLRRYVVKIAETLDHLMVECLGSISKMTCIWGKMEHTMT